MPLLVDTSVWIEFFERPESQQAFRLAQAMDQIEVVIGDLVAVELLQGLRAGPRLRLVETALKQFRSVSLCNPDLAFVAAANYRKLRQSGITVRSTIDVILATWCIENDAALLHNDRDFLVMEEKLGLLRYRVP